MNKGLRNIVKIPADDIAYQSQDWNPQGRRWRGQTKITWPITVVEEGRAYNRKSGGIGKSFSHKQS